MTVIINPLADNGPYSSAPLPPEEYDNARNSITCGLYNSERQRDVTFVAGLGGDTWRFPGHRAVLAAANPVFRAMLCGPLAEPNTAELIHVKDVDKRAFEQLLRYLYGETVNLPSVATARATLEAAHKYICPGLVKQCVIYLDLNLSPSTVLEVFQDLRFFCSRVPSPGNIPSAPPIQESTGAEAAMTEMCDSLFHNCLIFIDENADDVLRQEATEELSFEDISIIAPRDTLKVNCEMELFNALNRWCISECKRCKKELISANRRQVLGQLSYSVRYLLMTEKEFLSGPKASELLDLAECDMILRRVKGDKSVKFSMEQEEMLRKFASPRITSLLFQPVHLSDRSVPRKSLNADNTINDNIDSKKSKKQKKKEAKKMKKKLKEEKELKEKRNGCSCSCFGQGLLRVFVCLFD